MEKRIIEILKNSKEYPEKLNKVTPIVNRLYAYGNVKLLGQKSIAVIGSRNSSEYGRLMAERITGDLVQNDIVIVSGMAIGIDSVAHRTCLQKNGKTIAVLGSGFKNIFPKENIELFYEIVENGGLVLSEYSLDEPVSKKNFPMRNRIISALSDGVVVVEASYRSGTSITAKYAKIQGKEVFCVPNSVGNKNSYGSIEMMKKGAHIISSGIDIIRTMGYEIKESSIKNHNLDKVKSMGKDVMGIFSILRKYDELDCEQIANLTNINIAKVNQLLTYMELEDIIVNTKFNKYRLGTIYYE